MTTPLSTLPPVTPIYSQTQLTFTEFNRVVQQLLSRDRVLEEAVVNFIDDAALARTKSLLDACELILGTDLTEGVITSGALPAGFDSFDAFQAAVKDRLAALEANTQVTDQDGENPKSLKALVLSNQQTLAALTQSIDEFDKELESVKALTNDIAAIKTTVDAFDSRVTDVENLVADLADEVKNARKELSADPSKRLVDKIDAMDAISAALQTTVNGLVKEVTDARAADRFDSLAERLGDIEGAIEALQELLSQLKGRGTVTGIKVGRSILHGPVEIIPGSNISITRERNGIRIDVVDKATCIDMTAPVGDPNSACCGPSSVQIAN